MTLSELRTAEALMTAGPWIRRWASTTVHWMGGDDALTSELDIDGAVALRNAAPALLRLAAAAIAVEEAHEAWRLNAKGGTQLDVDYAHAEYRAALADPLFGGVER